MRTLLRIAAGLLIAALSTLVQAQNAPRKGLQPLAPAALKALLETFSINRALGLYTGPDVPCDIGVECPVVLTPQELFDTDGNLVACAMQVGEIKIAVGAHPRFGQPTLIHWTIGPPAAHKPPTTATYAFKSHGIIVFRDDDGATLKRADSVSDTDLTMTHRYRRHGGEVIYYPIVFQTIGSNPPALCGSADPKMVND